MEKEWCLGMANLEGDVEIGAGVIEETPPEVLMSEASRLGAYTIEWTRGKSRASIVVRTHAGHTGEISMTADTITEALSAVVAIAREATGK